MREATARRVFGEERLAAYTARPQSFDKGLKHYIWNIKISEALFPVLAIFEVVLRNQICCELEKNIGKVDWYDDFTDNTRKNQVSSAHDKATQTATKKNRQKVHADVIAELTLGFWVSLFNQELEYSHWNHMLFVFPNLDKTKRQRHNVSSPLNRIKNLRNRIFHHEPIFWNAQVLERRYTELIEVIYWMDKEAHQLAVNVSRFDAILQQAKADLGMP